jgi:aminoglycoside phosphotransferase family enzyme
VGRFDAAFQMQKEPRGPTPPTAAEVAETHISWIFLTPTRAFKLLKPVEMPFFDHRAADARIEATTTELNLNRRIAPDVYLGLAPVEEEGAVVDQMIVMRRMPALRRLSALVDDPDFADHLRAIARLVAGFHATQPPVSPAPMATIAAVRKNWRENFDVLDDVVGSVIDPDDAISHGPRWRTTCCDATSCSTNESVMGGFATVTETSSPTTSTASSTDPEFSTVSRLTTNGVSEMCWRTSVFW